MTAATSPLVGGLQSRRRGPALAVTCNAVVWGLSWWPFRWLNEAGVHPLWATMLIYTVASGLVLAARPWAFRRMVCSPALWVLLLSSGLANAAFNWALVIGDVVRVVLLFYLMPVWSALLARLLLNEAFTLRAAVRMLLALGGAVAVLWPTHGTLQWAGVTGTDGLAVLGGFCFALNNVMLRREADQPEEGRALAMFSGGMLVSGLLAWALAHGGQLQWLPSAQAGWLLMVTALALVFLLGNLALQYGAARLPAHVTAVLMMSEVLAASLSSWWLGTTHLTVPMVAGGMLILWAGWLAMSAPMSVEARP